MWKIDIGLVLTSFVLMMVGAITAFNGYIMIQDETFFGLVGIWLISIILGLLLSLSGFYILIDIIKEHFKEMKQ